MVQYFDGLVQDCSVSIANALDILQSCAKPSILWYCIQHSKDDDKDVSLITVTS